MAFNNFPYADVQDLNIDWLLRSMKDAVATANSAKEMAESLKTFVETYFDNLDVQQEINNKIDVMASNGYFENMITEITPDIVGAWLSTHITNPTNPVIDTSLTVSGAAADAKVTGDRIKDNANALQQMFQITRSPSGYNIGRMVNPNTGTTSSGHNEYVTISYQLNRVACVLVLANPNYLFRVYGYDGTSSSDAVYTGEITNGWTESGIEVFVPNTPRVTVNIKKQDNTIFTSSEEIEIMQSLIRKFPYTEPQYTIPLNLKANSFYTSEYPNTQAVCCGPDSVFAAFHDGNDLQPTILTKLDIATGTVQATNDGTNYGHANGMTYYSGSIYIATLGNASYQTEGMLDTDPQMFNVIGVAKASDLSHQRYFSVNSQMKKLGKVFTSSGRELECPHISAVHYDDSKKCFVCLVSPYRLSDAGSVTYRGVAFFDEDWNLFDFVRLKQLSYFMPSDITSDKNYYYLNGNHASAENYMLVYDKKFNYIGQARYTSPDTGEFECSQYHEPTDSWFATRNPPSTSSSPRAVIEQYKLYRDQIVPKEEATKNGHIVKGV